MPAHTQSDQQNSPLAILTELAVEGTSTFIEAQRVFLGLAQQENNLLMNGVKERIESTPAVAMTDLVRRGLDTLIEMQQEFLTTTSKQTIHLLEAVQTGKGDPGAHLVELAREGMQNFARSYQKFLNVITQETIKATGGAKSEPSTRPAKKTELAKLAHEATDLLIDAQKRVLDVVGQQVNVNLDAATRAAETLSSAQLAPMTQLSVNAVKSFFEGEKKVIDSLVGLGKKSKVGGDNKHPRAHRVRQRKTA